MLHATKGIASTIYFTATEMCELSNPYFLFVFTNKSTGSIVKYVATNTTLYNYRYDKVVLNANLFSNFDSGLWVYKIYEQLSDTNTNESGLNMVEQGYIRVSEEPVNIFESYQKQDNSFKTYGG